MCSGGIVYVNIDFGNLSEIVFAESCCYSLLRLMRNEFEIAFYYQMHLGWYANSN